MLSLMNDFTSQKGTLFHNFPFEIGRNKDMINWMPKYSTYLNYMNNNMFDLMNIFKEDYIDFKFLGSISLKNVLPVLCPDMDIYKELNVQDGTMALDTWGRMILIQTSMIILKRRKSFGLL